MTDDKEIKIGTVIDSVGDPTSITIYKDRITLYTQQDSLLFHTTDQIDDLIGFLLEARDVVWPPQLTTPEKD
jgi:hypothetical protein